MNTTRKHRQQMSIKEIGILETRIRQTTPNFGSNGHQAQRMAERGVSEDEVRAALAFGQVIELSVTDTNDVRCLVRWDTERVSIVTVISIKTGWICTAWKNSPRDHHSTCKTIYTPSLNVAALL